jgi:hypothetical protein
MVRISIDITHLAIAQMYADAATARAHVASGFLDLLDSGHGLDWGKLDICDILSRMRPIQQPKLLICG